MKALVYSTKNFERPYLVAACRNRFSIEFIEDSLSPATAAFAKGYDAVIIFAGDDCSAHVIETLHGAGIKYIATRAAGFDNIDIQKAEELNIRIANVPAYSPNAIAEHAIALMMALNRKIILANQQVHQHNFTLDNLIAYDFINKTAGIIGTGRIGSVVARILHGFGCNLLGFDPNPGEDLSTNYALKYVDLKELCRMSDIITIHTPLNAQTKHLINKDTIQDMKKGVMLINTSRGSIINTQDVIEGLETGKIGYLGADVYEFEKGVFFYDYSDKPLEDDLLKRLMSFPNVLLTPHQAFATREALSNIAETTFYNIECWEGNLPSPNELTAQKPFEN